MKKIVLLVVAFGVIFTGFGLTPAYARSTLHKFSINEALNSDGAQGRINPNIRLYFAGQNAPGYRKNFGVSRTNKKTNAFNKTDKEACEWVFLSALIQLQLKAEQLGANAVINIKSNYKSKEFASPREYECAAGGVLAGVALKGEFVRTN